MRKIEVSKSHPWHPSNVTTQKMNELYKRVEALLEEMFKRDEDGDFPVEIRLVNRTVHETMAGYLAIPYVHRAETSADFDVIMSRLLSNLNRAARELEQLIQIKKDADLSDPEPKEDPLRSEICRILGGSPTATDERILHNLRAAIDRPIPPVPEPKIISFVPTLVPPVDLTKGDLVILFEGPNRKHSEAKVIYIILAGSQPTDNQIKLWFNAAEATTRKIASWRKPFDYIRVVFQRKDGTYLVAPHSVDQLKSFVVKILNVRSEDS